MGKVKGTGTLEIRLAENLWLNYFNRYLFENGIINEKEYKKMTEKIAERKAKYSKAIIAC